MTSKLDIIGEEILEQKDQEEKFENGTYEDEKRPSSALIKEANKILEGLEKQDSSENLNKNSRIHPVPHYSDTVNMWEKLCCLDKEEKNVTRYPNGRSMFTVQVSERIFKLKKNPLY